MARPYVRSDEVVNAADWKDRPIQRPEIRRQRTKKQDQTLPQTRLKRIYEHSDSLDAALEQLRTVQLLRQNLQNREDRLVSFAKRNGATWAQLGDLYGISKQAAHQRWGIHSNPSSPSA
jgi:hypothetical protein